MGQAGNWGSPIRWGKTSPNSRYTLYTGNSVEIPKVKWARPLELPPKLISWSYDLYQLMKTSPVEAAQTFPFTRAKTQGEKI